MSNTRQVDIEKYFGDSIMMFGVIEDAKINKKGMTINNSYIDQLKEDPVYGPAELKEWRSNNLVNKIINNLGKLENIDVPSELKCPITKKLFYEPVVAANGETYERTALIEQLKKNDGQLPNSTIKDEVTLYEQKPYLYGNLLIKNLIEKEYEQQYKNRQKEMEAVIAKANTPDVEARGFLSNLKRQLDHFSKTNNENSAVQRAIGYNPPRIRKLKNKVDSLISQMNAGEKTPELVMESVIKSLAGIKQKINPATNKETSVSELARVNLKNGLEIIDKLNEMGKEEKLLKFLDDEINRKKITPSKIKILENYKKRIESIENKDNYAFSVLLHNLEKDILKDKTKTIFPFFSNKSDAAFTKNFQALKQKLEDQMKASAPKKSSSN